MSKFGKAEFWEKRYAKEFAEDTHDPPMFDWYHRFYSFREELLAILKPEHKILVVGAGNSRLSEDLYDEGFENIHNIDFSQTLIKAMSEKYKEKCPGLKYTQMDVRAMEFETGSFDVIIDKGTLDSVLCGEGSATNSSKMISEVYKTLNNTGAYFLFSHGAPEQRLKLLEPEDLKAQPYDWTIKVTTKNKPTIQHFVTPSPQDKQIAPIHYIYTCTRPKTVAQIDQIQPS